MKPVFVGVYTDQGPFTVNANAVSFFEERENRVTLFMNNGRELEILENAESFMDKVQHA